jgi:translocation and assembly module TamA
MAEKKLILAGWGRIGTIFGDSTLDIPANKRLYSGGAGSVRGYALNSIGPLDFQDDPIGGRSSTEFGIELRWRAIGPFGFVAFTEAGGVYDDPLPEWGKRLQWGAGLGVRYLTKIGPLRLDVAVPLNRRNSVDDSFQILVSLGQAF